jgi:predicted XRE-type DNA-binding protein
MTNNHNKEFIKGSGNAFADLNLPNAPELQFKSQLGLEIRRAIEAKGLTQSAAAKLTGTDQSRISKIVNYRTAEMSIDRLIRVLHALGYRIPVQVEPLHKVA